MIKINFWQSILETSKWSFAFAWFLIKQLWFFWIILILVVILILIRKKFFSDKR